MFFWFLFSALWTLSFLPLPFFSHVHCRIGAYLHLSAYHASRITHIPLQTALQQSNSRRHSPLLPSPPLFILDKHKQTNKQATLAKAKGRDKSKKSICCLRPASRPTSSLLLTASLLTKSKSQIISPSTSNHPRQTPSSLGTVTYFTQTITTSTSTDNKARPSPIPLSPYTAIL